MAKLTCSKKSVASRATLRAIYTLFAWHIAIDFHPIVEAA